MQKKRLQNRIAQSRWTLPVALGLALCVWVPVALARPAVWPCLGLTLLATLFMAELNNANMLLRVYSRMVSCSFLALLTAAPMLFGQLQLGVVALCTVGFFSTLFRCYQQPHATAWVFYAFLCLSLASVVWVQMLFLLPVAWAIMVTLLFCLNASTFVASLLGLLLPYWLVLGYCAVTANAEWLITHFTALAHLQPVADLTAVTPAQTALLLLTTACAVTGATHFLANAHADKIRTRMLYIAFIIVDAAALVFLVLQPQHFTPLWAIMATATAPLIAHFMALTRGAWSAYTTYIIMAATAALTITNLWPLLPIF